jgi:hypothetical protein
MQKAKAVNFLAASYIVTLNQVLRCSYCKREVKKLQL